MTDSDKDIDQDQAVKDEMVAFLMTYRKKSNIQQLKEDVNNLINMTTQMDAGQRKAKNDVDWIELKPTLWSHCVRNNSVGVVRRSR